MCNSELKLGPCTITSKAGAGTLEGEVLKVYPESFEFMAKGTRNVLIPCTADWTFDYATTLPKEVGAVIEIRNGERWLLQPQWVGELSPWVRIDLNGKHHGSAQWLAGICKIYGGFKLLLEGVKS